MITNKLTYTYNYGVQYQQQPGTINNLIINLDGDSHVLILCIYSDAVLDNNQHLTLVLQWGCGVTILYMDGVSYPQSSTSTL